MRKGTSLRWASIMGCISIVMIFEGVYANKPYIQVKCDPNFDLKDSAWLGKGISEGNCSGFNPSPGILILSNSIDTEVTGREVVYTLQEKGFETKTIGSGEFEFNSTASAKLDEFISILRTAPPLRVFAPASIRDSIMTIQSTDVNITTLIRIEVVLDYTPAGVLHFPGFGDYKTWNSMNLKSGDVILAGITCLYRGISGEFYWEYFDDDFEITGDETHRTIGGDIN